MYGIDERLAETMMGHCTTVVALVIALEKYGVIAREKYIDALHSLWQEMTEDDAVGEAGAVVERVLDLLDADTGSERVTNNNERGHGFQNCDKAAINDDTATYPELAEKLMHGIVQAASRS